MPGSYAQARVAEPVRGSGHQAVDGEEPESIGLGHHIHDLLP
ncbi:hypothetical protein [Streptomyces sp. NRRL F-5126]|nr:hypothetical protein [Streptomyces sp. NRRL F-5126]